MNALGQYFPLLPLTTSRGPATEEHEVGDVGDTEVIGLELPAEVSGAKRGGDKATTRGVLAMKGFEKLALRTSPRSSQDLTCFRCPPRTSTSGRGRIEGQEWG
jgi:hypothetical protein